MNCCAGKLASLFRKTKLAFLWLHMLTFWLSSILGIPDMAHAAWPALIVQQALAHSCIQEQAGNPAAQRRLHKYNVICKGNMPERKRPKPISFGALWYIEWSKLMHSDGYNVAGFAYLNREHAHKWPLWGWGHLRDSRPKASKESAFKTVSLINSISWNRNESISTLWSELGSKAL